MTNPTDTAPRERALEVLRDFLSVARGPAADGSFSIRIGGIDMERAQAALSAPPAETACEVEGWRPPAEITEPMMDAGQRYIDSIALNGQHTLPAMFRWGGLWAAMLAAALPTPPSDSALVRQDGTAEREPSNQQQGEGK